MPSMIASTKKQGDYKMEINSILNQIAIVIQKTKGSKKIMDELKREVLSVNDIRQNTKIEITENIFEIEIMDEKFEIVKKLIPGNILGIYEVTIQKIKRYDEE